MRNQFLRWLEGAPPQSVGMYWGDEGVCLVHQGTSGRRTCVYQPPSVDGEQSPLSIAIKKLKTYGNITSRDLSLAVAINADDVFIRSLVVPSGLSDAQLEQVAIVEAVANLPVPPEEICMDFMRTDQSESGQNENVRLAFCRRERIDDILAAAEGVPVSVSVVDRDVQALHDAVLGRALNSGMIDAPDHPFAMLLTEITPRLVICLDALSFETYPIRIPVNPTPELLEDLRQQLSNCWMRCRMVRGDDSMALNRLICIGAALPVDGGWLHGLNGMENCEVFPCATMDLQSLIVPGESNPPDEALLIAAGMCDRALT